MTNNTSISVLMPVYNGSMYLREAIQSVLNQTYEDFELIIVNDASKDESEHIILSFSDSRIKYHRNSNNIGLVGALNVGLKMCNGKYIARMDQDDISRKDRFRKQFDFLEMHPDYVIVGSHIQIIEKNILYYPTTDAAVKTAMLIGTPFAHPAIMMRNNTLTTNNLFYLETYKHAEDYGFWVELSRFGKMANLDEVLLDYRRHATQYSVEYKTQMNMAAAKARNRYLDLLQLRCDEQTRKYINKCFDFYSICESRYELQECGGLLLEYQKLFQDTSLDHLELQKIVKKSWRKLCLNFQKTNSFQAYLTFLKNSLSENTNIKTHLFFMKNIFLGSFSKAST